MVVQLPLIYHLESKTSIPYDYAIALQTLAFHMVLCTLIDMNFICPRLVRGYGPHDIHAYPLLYANGHSLQRGL